MLLTYHNDKDNVQFGTSKHVLAVCEVRERIALPQNAAVDHK